jgi:hypothetical protein
VHIVEDNIDVEPAIWLKHAIYMRFSVILVD